MSSLWELAMGKDEGNISLCSKAMTRFPGHWLGITKSSGVCKAAQATDSVPDDATNPSKIELNAAGSTLACERDQ